MTAKPEYVLYCAPNSYAMIAHAVLEEVAADYRVRWVGLFQDRPDADFLAVSPHARVPALDGPDGPVFETGAIAFYLAERHGRADLLVGESEPSRGRFLQWMHYLASTVQPDVMIQFHPELYFDDEATRARFKAVSMSRLAKVLDVIEAALDPGPYFFADRLTVCDFCLAMQAVWPEIFPGPIDDYPRIARLTGLVSDRPAAARVLAAHDAAWRRANPGRGAMNRL